MTKNRNTSQRFFKNKKKTETPPKKSKSACGGVSTGTDAQQKLRKKISEVNGTSTATTATTTPKHKQHSGTLGKRERKRGRKNLDHHLSRGRAKLATTVVVVVAKKR